MDSFSTHNVSETEDRNPRGNCWRCGRLEQIDKMLDDQCNRDGQSAYTGKNGVQIRVPFAPDKLSIVGYHDKANTVPVDPVQVKRIRTNFEFFNNPHTNTG